MKQNIVVHGLLAALLSVGVVGCASFSFKRQPTIPGMELLGDRDGSLPPPIFAADVVPASENFAPEQVPAPVSVPAVQADPFAQPELPGTSPVAPEVKPVAPEVKSAAPETVSQEPKKIVKHKVQKGETLGGIARQYGVKTSDLANANGIKNRNRLLAGKVLVIPDGTVVSANESKKSATSEGKKKAKPAEKKKVQITRIPMPADGIYTVVQGDSLWKIARKLGIKESVIKELNPGLVAPYRLNLGQKLKVKDMAPAAPVSAVENPVVPIVPETTEPASAPESLPIPENTNLNIPSVPATQVQPSSLDAPEILPE